MFRIAWENTACYEELNKDTRMFKCDECKASAVARLLVKMFTDPAKNLAHRAVYEEKQKTGTGWTIEQGLLPPRYALKPVG